jgi:hypothetical protein
MFTASAAATSDAALQLGSKLPPYSSGGRTLPALVASMMDEALLVPLGAGSAIGRSFTGVRT